MCGNLLSQNQLDKKGDGLLHPMGAALMPDCGVFYLDGVDDDILRNMAPTPSTQLQNGAQAHPVKRPKRWLSRKRFLGKTMDLARLSSLGFDGIDDDEIMVPTDQIQNA